MTKAATVELDFFGIDKQKPPLTPPAHKLRNTIPGLQDAIPTTRSAMASAQPPTPRSGWAAPPPSDRAGHGHYITQLSPRTPAAVDSVSGRGLLRPLPVANPSASIAASSSSSSRSSPETQRQATAPLTIFYNGSVSVFDVPRDKAEVIMRMAQSVHATAEQERAAPPPPPPIVFGNDRQMDLLQGDLPNARKLSLQRFFEKRKGRLLTTSPYECTLSPSQ